MSDLVVYKDGSRKVIIGMQQWISKGLSDALAQLRMGISMSCFMMIRCAAQNFRDFSASRNKNAENPIPMAGVPYHSAQQYIDVLVESGYR